MAVSLDTVDVQLLNELQTDADRPNVELARRFVLVSGDAAGREVRAFRERTGMVVLEKPFELSILAAAVERAASPAPQ